MNKLTLDRNHSHNQAQDIIVAIETSLTVGTNVKDLWELENILFVHTENSGGEDKHAVLHGSRLNILVVNLILNFLEAKRLDFLSNLL